MGGDTVRERKSVTLDIRSQEVKRSVERLDDLIRAEYNATSNFLDYYAGKENIGKVYGYKNQVIYGRRGTGKTHLLRALQEQLMIDTSIQVFPIYIDARKFKPLLKNDTPLYYSLILFKEIVIELLRMAYENVEFLYRNSDGTNIRPEQLREKQDIIRTYLERFNATFKGSTFYKLGDIAFSSSEIESVAASLKLSIQPEAKYDIQKSSEAQTSTEEIKYISFSEMSDIVDSLISNFNIERLYLLIDEWSEIPIDTQPFLAELLKRTFITLKVTLKIAAIPNRTRLMIDKGLGLENSGDIFGHDLDNRYIYELNQETTKAFFNELLFNQLSLVNHSLYKKFYDEKSQRPVHNFINLFLANQALREILIASAGIPRDFLSIFINAYAHFTTRKNTVHRHMALQDIRTATVSWYEVDKKKAVEANHNAKVMLDKIIEEILISKKRCHFLIPEKYETNQTLNELIDLRVIHLRKHGIAHKGNRGVSYNVYYIDYACYTSSNMFHNKINTNLLNEIETTDDFRTIRRISLEDKFFDSINAELGNGFKCPHCGRFVDTSHPAYVKQKICNNCYEKVEE